MKKKMSMSAVFTLPLSSFNIRPLTLWVKRPERQLEESLRLIRSRKDLSGESLEKKLQESRTEHLKSIDAQPKTVGELIKAHPYRFGKKHSYGLGKETIAKLKEKLVELGLTPDDWPALVYHNKLLHHLSKKVIVNLPLSEIRPTGRSSDYIYAYLGCEEEEFYAKTVHDLIQINPLQIVNGPDRYTSSNLFFRDHKIFFVVLRQQLVKKGFGLKDGEFFKWNCGSASLKKAEQVLKKHKLAPSEVKRFAKIVVAERWIV